MAKRTRKSPEQRTQEILDAAARVVLREGVAQATMSQVAREAGVSKGLMYAYFANRTDLLTSVLSREEKHRAERHFKVIRGADSFEVLARETFRVNQVFDRERGELANRIKADTVLADALSASEAEVQSNVVEFLAESISTQFDVPKPIGRVATSLLLGFDHEPLKEGPQAAELWGAMMQGAASELKRRYGEET